jgi:transcriptional regulator with XRE-family HTH domain
LTAESKMSLETKLSVARRSLGLSIGQAAMKAGLSSSVWSRLERGKGRFSLDEIRAAAKAVNLRLSVEARY